MMIELINNPRKENGDFGDLCCGICGKYSGAYIKLSRYIICGGCLDLWKNLINKTILNDAVEKGRATKYGR